MIYKAEDIALIEEIAGTTASDSAPVGMTFSRPNNVNAGTWLMYAGNPSNVVGAPYGLNNGKLILVWSGNQDASTYDLEIYTHEGNGISLTLLTTVSIVASRIQAFTAVDFGAIAVSPDVQIAVKLATGTAKNITTILKVSGTP